MLSFSSLSQIPSPILLPIYLFSPFLYVSPSFTFLPPVELLWSRGMTFLALLCKGDPPFSRAHSHTSFILLCSSFFSCFIFFRLLSMPSAFICCQVLSVLLDRHVPVPQPHIYLGNLRTDDSPGSQCAAPSLSSWLFCVSPVPDRSVKEVGGKEIGGCYCLTWCGSPVEPCCSPEVCMQLPVCPWKKSWGCVDSSIPGSGHAPRTGQC